jgi:hypothetical protein
MRGGGGGDEGSSLSASLTNSGDLNKVVFLGPLSSICGGERGGGSGGGDGGREGERRLGDIGGGGGGLGRGDGARATRAVDGPSEGITAAVGSFTSPSANCLSAEPTLLRAMT